MGELMICPWAKTKECIDTTCKHFSMHQESDVCVHIEHGVIRGKEFDPEDNDPSWCPSCEPIPKKLMRCPWRNCRETGCNHYNIHEMNEGCQHTHQFENEEHEPCPSCKEEKFLNDIIKERETQIKIGEDIRLQEPKKDVRFEKVGDLYTVFIAYEDNEWLKMWEGEMLGDFDLNLSKEYIQERTCTYRLSKPKENEFLKDEDMTLL